MNIKDIGIWKCNRCKIIIPPCKMSFHDSDYIFCSESCQYNKNYINKFLIYKFNKKVLEYLKFNDKINSVIEVEKFKIPKKSYENLNNLHGDIENAHLINENRNEFKKIISNKNNLIIIFKNYNIFINKYFCVLFITFIIFIYYYL